MLRIGCHGRLVCCIALSAWGWGSAPAGEQLCAPGPKPLLERETLTEGWFRLEDKLASEGLSVNLGATNIFQHNVRGGMKSDRGSHHYSGSYDLEFRFDFEKMAEIKGGSFYLLTEGSWGEGIDAHAVGSLFGVNADANGDRLADVTQAYYEQALLDGALRIRIGKLDLTGSFECHGCPVAFDSNAFANDETTQFLNGALVNNPTIPFPQEGLGVIAYLQPMEHWYVSVGSADAQADRRESGFNTAFSGRDDLFTIFETGVTPHFASTNGPLQGAYRVGAWHDAQSKARFVGAGTEKDELGGYLCADQMVWREREKAGDNQGLGVFARFGVADAKVDQVKSFWSVGLQYQGLVPSRDEDVLGLGFARGSLSRGVGFAARDETVAELYYNAKLTPWLSLSPSVQYVANPGGTDKSDAIVVGVRLQMAF